MFSIIMPTGNSELTIEESIETVLRQEVPFELIIGLNNTTDNTADIVYSYQANKNIKIINYGEVSSGISYVLNKLINEAQSEYIVRHDSDDYMYGNRLTVLKWIYEQDQAPDIIGTNFTTNFKQLNKFMYMENKLLTKRDFQGNIRKDNDLIVKERIILGVPFCHPTISFKKTSLKYMYDTNYKYAQDLKLYVDNIFDCQYYYSTATTLDYTITQKHLDNKSIKRKLQLMLHDRAICSLHKKVLGKEFNLRKSILLRLRYVTNSSGIEDGTYSILLANEIPEAELMEYYGKIRNKLADKSSSIINNLQ